MTEKRPSRDAVGVLALQGDFVRHVEALSRSGIDSVEVRRIEDLALVSGLVLPGGESTTILKFFESEPWEKALRDFAAEGKPILATCAGLILLAREVDNPKQRSLGLLDVSVTRNAYGRQVDSFIGRAVDESGGELEAVFIRAPRIVRVGPAVSVIARQNGDPVWVREGSIHAASFHPELSEDSSVHRHVFS